MPSEALAKEGKLLRRIPPFQKVPRACPRGSMLEYFLRYVFPGLGLILLAFFAGTHPNVIFAFLGFLSFFVVGVTLIVEGNRKRKKGGGA